MSQNRPIIKFPVVVLFSYKSSKFLFGVVETNLKSALVVFLDSLQDDSHAEGDCFERSQQLRPKYMPLHP